MKDTMPFVSIEKLPHLDQLCSDLGQDKKFCVLYDSALEEHELFKKWLLLFNWKISLQAGESLKSLSSFETIMNETMDLTRGCSQNELFFIAVGGGSVGDFVGFLASVYKRGAGLIHIPSTWLAAVDSSHGGKTALNCGGMKNQIGTFYPAHKIYLCKELLWTLPEEHALNSLGEFYKMAFLQSSSRVSEMSCYTGDVKEFCWSFLGQCIEEKYSIVEKDPEEKIGIRYLLNLGHTVGHAIEAEKIMAHGEAVRWGLRFALEFSKEQIGLEVKSLNEAIGLLEKYHQHEDKPQISTQSLVRLLMQDKKRSEDGISFILLKELGKAEVRKMSLKEVLTFAEKHGWAK